MKQYIRFWQAFEARSVLPFFASTFKHILYAVLSLQLAVAPAVAFAGQTPSTASATPIGYFATIEAQDPILDEFIKTPFSGTLRVSADDSAIDRDPFFLRSQQWLQSKTTSLSDAIPGDFTFLKSKSGVDIRVEGVRQTLHINLPVTPIYQTEEFIFLSLDQGSPLFANASGHLAEGETVGEGLFVINTQELAARAIQKLPVPIYFLPLPGNGWTGNIDALEFPKLNILAVENATGLALPLDLNDVHNVVKVESLNLLMASLLTLRPGAKPGLPPPGSTEGFGMFFTGLDLAQTQNSLWEVASRSQQFKNQIARILRLLSPIQQAHAFDLPPDLIQKLAYVGTILGSTLIASFVAKMTIFRDEFKRRHRNEPQTFANNTKNTFKDTITVFSESLKTIGQMAPVTFANAVENFTDRLVPTITAADHTLVRRFMNKTIYWSRNSLKQIATNAWIFYLGALVLGTVDTASVVIQYLWVVPALCGWASPMLPLWWQHRIALTFSAGNSTTGMVILNDSVRNGAAWLQNGGARYGTNTQAQYQSQYQNEVDEELRIQKKNPLAVENQQLREQMISDKMNRVMKQRGMPDKSESLFDAATVNNMLPKALGYRDQITGQSYLLEARWGLTARALDRAIEVAQAQAEGQSNEVYAQVLAILKDTRAKMSWAKAAFAGPKGIKRARELRRMLTLLSYPGPVDTVVKNVPQIWEQKYSPLAARGASVLFRNSLLSYLSKEGTEVLMPSAKTLEKFGQAAEAQAVTKVHNIYPKLSAQELISQHGYELEMEKHQAISTMLQAEMQKREALAYKPPKKGWVARWQEARAARKANKGIQIEMAQTAADMANPPNQSDYKKQWTKLYTQALARTVGLYVQPNNHQELLQYVEQKAETLTQAQFQNVPGLGDYLQTLSSYERMKVEASFYAVNYLRQYKEATTDSELVPALSTAQPGRFQWIRQRFIRNSKIGTRMVRFFESFGSDQSLELGLNPMLKRNIPFYDDMMTAIQQTISGMAMGSSVRYLFNYYVWQVHYPYGTWLLFQLASPLIIAPDQWLSRFFRQQGLKPKGTVWSMLLYSFPYAWTTFLGSIPLLLFAPDAQAIYQDYVRDPLLSVVSQVPVGVYAGAAAAGTLATSSRLRRFIKSKFPKKAEEAPSWSTSAPTCQAMFEGT